MPKIKNYIVACYHNMHHLSDNKYLDNLFIEDFDTLSGKNWLSNIVIDACISVLSRLNGKKHVQSLPCELVMVYLNVEKQIGILPNDMMMRINNSSLLIMPFNVKKNHWVVGFLDYSKRTCTVMDPMKPNAINDRQCKKLISTIPYTCKFVTADGKESTVFPELNIVACTDNEVPVQTDVYNCGVFVLYYIQTVIKGVKFDNNFNPMKFRKKMKTCLVKNSKDMTNMCLYCGVFKDININNTEWIACKTCRRRVEKKCIPAKDRLKNYDTVHSFNCILCSNVKNV